MSACERLVVPDLGAGVSATIAELAVVPGQQVDVGALIAQLESEKAVLEITAERAGRVVALLVAKGDTVSAGAALLELAVGEASAPAEGASPRAATATEAPAEPIAAPAVPGQRNAGRSPGGSVANPVAASVASPIPPADERVPRRVAGPAVRQLARRLGVDLECVPGGADGVVRRADVERWVRENAAVPTPGSSPPIAAGVPAAPGLPASVLVGATELAASRLRRECARQMELARSVPHAWVRRDLELGPVLRWRAALAARGQRAPSLTAWFVRAVALALVQHPALRRAWDPATRMLWQRDAIAVGVAVDTPDGLAVVTLPEPQDRPLTTLAAALAAAAERARAGRLEAADVAPAILTISNLGAFGIDELQPLVRWPEAAILGLGRVRAADPGAPGAGGRVGATVGFDHRAIDGADAARFLATLADFAAEPLNAWL